MDFGLDETQREVRDLATEVLRRETALDRTGDAYASETGYDSALWKTLATSGLLSLPVPENLGGAGLGPLETSLVLTEIGHYAAPVPALATLAAGVLPVLALGTGEQREELLPQVTEGRVLTAAFDEPGTPMPPAPRTTARLDGDQWLLHGSKIGAGFAASAHRVLVTATARGVSAPQGPVVLLVDPSADGVTTHARPTSSGAPEHALRLEGARVPATSLLGTGRGAVEALHRFALAGFCAVADGAMLGALELTAEHVGRREQFGKPLSAFQAVAQQVADAYVVRRTAHLATRSAWWRLGTGRDAAGDVEVAGYWLSSELLPALHVCHHLHGGIGVDQTYPMHRYYALVKDLVRAAGGHSCRARRLAETGI